MFDITAKLFKFMDRSSSVRFLTLNALAFCSVPHRRVRQTICSNSDRGKENARSVLV
jgi:hypothetical protein